MLDSKLNFYLNKNTVKDDISFITNLYNSLGYIDNSVKVMIENYSDIKIGDVIETYEEVKTERKL